MLSINFSELFWGIFNFFLLLFLLNRFLYKPLIKFMDDRKARIDAGLDEEKKALEEEQANNDGIEAALDEKRIEAKSIIEKAGAEDKASHSQAISEARSDAEKTVIDARENAAKVEKQLEERVKQQSQELARLLADKLL
mgnify:FL=1